jgi:hypothetical protein
MSDKTTWTEYEEALMGVIAKSTGFKLDITSKQTSGGEIAMAVWENRAVNRHAFIEKASDAGVDGYDVTFMARRLDAADEYDAVGDHFYREMPIAMTHVLQHLND